MVAYRNPKDSMVSTWRKDPSKWTWAHKFVSRTDLFNDHDDVKYPVFKKSDPIPYGSAWSVNRWILTHAIWPVAVQWAWTQLTGRNMHPVAVILLYLVAFQGNAMHQVHVVRRLAEKYGFFDGEKHGRDNVPDVGVNKVLETLEATTISRAIFTVFLAYRRDDPISFSWWLPMELIFYSIVLDFFFYTYHRACHEITGLWQYHRTHHLTKHPTMLLSGYADREQELIEMVLVPLATYATLKLMGFPMGFYDWWICHEYIIFAEAFGHSGLRIAAYTPGLSGMLLSLVDCQLMLEDHDLHHRYGWRKSANYGKQTLLWDRLFGTCGERLETTKQNIDWNHPVDMPWY